ncbi:TraX family protein [Cytobacillus praedii]
MTSTLLIILALIAIFIDHTGQYIPNTPEFLRWIGRLSAPIFIIFVI